jgi:hypothetical protein
MESAKNSWRERRAVLTLAETMLAFLRSKPEAFEEKWMRMVWGSALQWEIFSLKMQCSLTSSISQKPLETETSSASKNRTTPLGYTFFLSFLSLFKVHRPHPPPRKGKKAVSLTTPSSCFEKMPFLGAGRPPPGPEIAAASITMSGTERTDLISTRRKKPANWMALCAISSSWSLKDSRARKKRKHSTAGRSFRWGAGEDTFYRRAFIPLRSWWGYILPQGVHPTEELVRRKLNVLKLNWYFNLPRIQTLFGLES